MFIAKHEAAAEPYLAHEVVVSESAMRDHQTLLEDGRLEGEPLDADELAQLRAAADALIEQYGKAFKKAYGWAAPVLRAETGKPKIEPDLSDIERAVGVDHLRSWYRMAGHGVHAGPKAITWTPDLDPRLQAENVLLSGPGFGGLADPMQCVALSLVQATINLLMLSPGVNDLVLMRTLLLMSSDVAETAFRCGERLGRMGDEEEPAPAP